MNTACFLSIPAMMFPDQEILLFEGIRLTYGEIHDRVVRLANALRQLGLSRGSRVGVVQTNSNQCVEAYYAVSKIGGIFVPLNYRAKTEELRYLVDTGQVEMLLVGERYAELVASQRQNLTSVKHWIALEQRHADMLSFEELLRGASPDDLEEDMDGDETNILMYTSGTTSLPKGVMLSYGDFVDYIFSTVEPADGTGRESTLLCAPIFHIAGLSAIMASIYGGRRLVVMRQFEAKEWLRLVSQEKVTNAFLVPTMLKRLLDEPQFEASDVSSLETVSYGAAPMPLPVVRRAIDKFPKSVGLLNAFGQTETTSTVTMLLPEDHRLDGPPEEVEKKLKRLSSVGRPLPDVELKIVDNEGMELPSGQIGEVALRTSRLMKGYVAQDRVTLDPIVDGWIRTRDLGWVDEDGYVFLAGRKDDLIIRGGENIAPGEIEAVLHSHPCVEEAAVIGYPDEEWGERIMAVVVLRPEAKATCDELQEFCRQRMASYKKPERIVFSESLPRNALGKVLKKEIRALHAFNV